MQDSAPRARRPCSVGTAPSRLPITGDLRLKHHPRPRAGGGRKIKLATRARRVDHLGGDALSIGGKPHALLRRTGLPILLFNNEIGLNKGNIATSRTARARLDAVLAVDRRGAPCMSRWGRGPVHRPRDRRHRAAACSGGPRHRGAASSKYTTRRYKPMCSRRSPRAISAELAEWLQAARVGSPAAPRHRVDAERWRKVAKARSVGDGARHQTAGSRRCDRDARAWSR